MAVMVVAAVGVRGSDTIRIAAARSEPTIHDALYGEHGWTGEHSAELDALWGGGHRTQQECSRAAYRLHAHLRGLPWPRDRHTPCPGTTRPGTTPTGAR
ncbi:MAG: hypothetical protein ACRDRH_27140 [Pseudonocardia sp.]